MKVANFNMPVLGIVSLIDVLVTYTLIHNVTAYLEILDYIISNSFLMYCSLEGFLDGTICICFFILLTLCNTAMVSPKSPSVDKDKARDKKVQKLSSPGSHESGESMMLYPSDAFMTPNAKVAFLEKKIKLWKARYRALLERNRLKSSVSMLFRLLLIVYSCTSITIHRFFMQ